MQYFSYTIGYGDTVHLLAQTYLGDANRWMDIVTANNLEYPFIVNEISDNPKVKGIGDTILIPTDQVQRPVINNYEIDDIYKKALGQDLSLTSTEDSFIDLTSFEGEFDSNVYGDLKTVSGLDNLKQALILRYATPLGTLPYHPEFGSNLPELLGKAYTPENVQQIIIELERTTRTDPRVQDVTIEPTKTEQDALYINMKVTPVGFQQAFEMSLQFGEGGIIQWA